VSEVTRPPEDEVAVARVYAQALLALGREKETTKELLDEIGDLVESVDQAPKLARFLASPLVETEQREAILEHLMRGKVSDLLINTLLVMNRKGRTGMLPALATAYREEYMKLVGLISVEVRTATPLTEGQRRELAEAVSEYSGKKTLLEEAVDPSLIGGMVLHVGDQKIDSSVARELGRLQQAFMSRASQEVRTVTGYVQQESEPT
jgi:F-type H+-transporting ATPase subunit delta